MKGATIYNSLKQFQASQLVKNMKKATIVQITPSNFLYSPLHITFAEHLPIATNAIKCLGLQLGSQLSWNPHVNYLLYKLSSVCSIVRRLSHVLDIHTMKTIYFVHFHSLVNYGILF